MTSRLRAFAVTALCVIPAGIAAQRGAPPPAAPQGPPVPQVRTSLIMGQVIDTDSEQPIAGALVRLAMRQLAAPPPAGTVPTPAQIAAQNQPLLQMTDSEGRFLFHGLPKGAAQLSATAAGYLAPNAGAAPRPLTLGENERVLDYKIRLARLAVISGLVIDEVGEPVVGQSVRAMRRGQAGSNPGTGTGMDAAMRTAQTDDRGMYRISGLSPGDYVAVVPQTQVTVPVALGEGLMSEIMGGGGMTGIMGDIMASGGADAMGALGGVRVGDVMWSTGGGVGAGPGSGRMPGPSPTASGRLSAYQTVFYPAALVRAQAATIALKSGEERIGVDFHLKLVPTSRITGTVMAPDGPAKSLAVHLIPAASADAGEDETLDVATATTAADGSFTMLGVPPGQYIAKVVKQPRPDFAAMMAANPEASAMMPPGLAGMMGGGSKELLSAQVPLGVGDTDVTGVTIALAAGAHVAGRLEFDGAAAKPTAQQMQQMRIVLTSSAGRSPGLGMVQDSAAADGTFKTSGYQPGRYTLNVTGPVGAWMIKSVTVGGNDITNDVIELKGTDISEVVVIYTDQISTIAGTVRAPATGTLTGITVIVFPANYAPWVESGQQRGRPAGYFVQQTGAFSAGRFPPGDYLVAALEETAMTGTQNLAFFERIARVATRVSLALGEKKTVDLDIAKVVR